MFSSTTIDSVGFDSHSDDLKSKEDASLQTCEVVVKSTGDQSEELQDKNVQCELSSENIIIAAEYDESKLLTFLNKVTGPLLKELDKVERSKAFTVQKCEHGLDEQNVKELYELSAQSPPGIINSKVSCLSWSSTGNVIAVGFESVLHEGWCTHESLVNFYNISSYKFDGKTATHSIQTDSCITGLAMHPYEPSVVAVATYSGNVEIWSVGKDKKNDGVCISKEQYHEDKITQISWAIDSAQQLILVTSSLDGRMCVLKNVSVGTSQLLEKFVLDPVSPDVFKKGVTCFSFCQQQPGTFVAGCENGELLLCSTFVTKSGTNGIEKSPVLRPIGEKTGPISYIKFSPHEDGIFLVVTLDMKITLYSILQDTRICDIYSNFEIKGADWSPFGAKTIIAWGKSAKLCAFDQDTGEKVAELIPENESLFNKRTYDKVMFNIKSMKLLALAGPLENSYIWELPNSFKGSSSF